MYDSAYCTVVVYYDLKTPFSPFWTRVCGCWRWVLNFRAILWFMRAKRYTYLAGVTLCTVLKSISQGATGSCVNPEKHFADAPRTGGTDRGRWNCMTLDMAVLQWEGSLNQANSCGNDDEHIAKLERRRIGSRQLRQRSNCIPDYKTLQSQSNWTLDVTHTLQHSVPDIRALQLDAAQLLNDPDGDKASLFWFLETFSSTL
jgi:hypothetical protein